MIRSLQVLFLLFIFSGNAAAVTSVWKISNDQHAIYIAGTIHVLRPQDYPLPAAFDLAYLLSDRIVFETDVSKASSSSFAEKLNEYFAYRNNLTLRSAITPQTYRELQLYCDSKAISISQLLPFKPQFVSLMLTSIELRRLGVSSSGVDQHYHERARGDNKPVDELESLEQQLSFLANMGVGQENELIRSTIRENQRLAQLMSTILQAWRTGNYRQLEREALIPMKQEFPGIYRELVVERNNNWLPLIEDYLKTPETEMLLVGALHLVGDDGLINRLRKLGYDIVQR